MSTESITRDKTGCGYVKSDYLSPWDEQQGHAPSSLTCNLPGGHTGYHRAAEDEMPFGPWRADAEPAEVSR